MDNNVNYTVVGIFVLGLALLMAMFLVWMAKFGFDEEAKDNYLIRMEEAVSGLNVESPVKYLGVDVGVVDRINIAEDDPRIVEVHISVEEGTPLTTDSKAKLASQGITGLSYIEIVGGSRSADRLRPGDRIPPGKSLLGKLEASADDIAAKIINTLNNVDSLLSEQNIASVSASLQRIELLLNDSNLASIEQTLGNAATFSGQLATRGDALIDSTITFEQQATMTLKDYSEIAGKLGITLDNVQLRIDRGEYDLRSMTEPHLEAFNDLLKRLELLSIQADELLEQLQHSPSDLIFKQNKTKAGPGEEQ